MSRNAASSKADCGYIAKPEWPICGTCAAFEFDTVLPAWMEAFNNANPGRQVYTLAEHGITKRHRCQQHGFPTTKTATCDTWTQRAATDA